MTSSTDLLLSELRTTGLTVDSYVLRSHDAFARVLNPATGVDGRPVPWSSYAPARFVPSSDFQWRDVLDDGRARPDTSPLMGTIHPLVVNEILGLLPIPSSGEIFVAQWEGYADAPPPPTAMSTTFPPDRETNVWLETASNLSRLPRVPMRWWHPDLLWVIGNDIYGRSIFVSGSTDVVDAIVSSSVLEAFHVSPGDRVGAEDF